MQAVVLVGGKGTRLQPLTLDTPKPIIPFVDRPFMGYMIEWLKSHGVSEIIFCCGFKANSFKACIDEIDYGIDIKFVEEPEVRGTGGALWFAKEYLENDFLMLNGDVLTDIDLSAQIRQHQQTGAKATLGLVEVDDPEAYGLVLCNQTTVESFVEKPSKQTILDMGIKDFFVSAGIYCLSLDVFDLIEQNKEVSIETKVWPALVGNGLHAYKAENSYWLDIGTPERYLQGTYDILTGKVSTKVLERLINGQSIHGLVDPEAFVDGPVIIEEGAVVEAGARIQGPSVIGKNVVIKTNAVIHKSVVLSDSEVQEGASLDQSIIAQNATIGKKCILDPESMVGENCQVEDNRHVEFGEKIF